eukprot:109701_1
MHGDIRAILEQMQRAFHTMTTLKDKIKELEEQSKNDRKQGYEALDTATSRMIDAEQAAENMKDKRTYFEKGCDFARETATSALASGAAALAHCPPLAAVINKSADFLWNEHAEAVKKNNQIFIKFWRSDDGGKLFIESPNVNSSSGVSVSYRYRPDGEDETRTFIVDIPDNYVSFSAVSLSEMKPKTVKKSLPESSKPALPASSRRALPAASMRALPAASRRALPAASRRSLPAASRRTLPAASRRTLPVAPKPTVHEASMSQRFTGRFKSMFKYNQAPQSAVRGKPKNTLPLAKQHHLSNPDLDSSLGLSPTGIMRMTVHLDDFDRDQRQFNRVMLQKVPLGCSVHIYLTHKSKYSIGNAVNKAKKYNFWWTAQKAIAEGQRFVEQSSVDEVVKRCSAKNLADMETKPKYVFY